MVLKGWEGYASRAATTLTCIVVSCSSGDPKIDEDRGAALRPDASVDASSPAPGFSRTDFFGENPGDLVMHTYVPEGLGSDRPLVVLLHGCTQSAVDALDLGWRELADRYEFSIVLPEQSAANQSLRCFQWYQSEDITRGRGEIESIVSMIDHAQARMQSDSSRTFVSGFSAGGAFSAALMAVVPERFEAGAIQSGVPFGCSQDVSSALPCQRLDLYPWLNKSGREWGDAVRAQNPQVASEFPRVTIWHGALDLTVSLVDAQASFEQWADVHGLNTDLAVRNELDGGAALRLVTKGHSRVELHRFDNMGHAQTGSSRSELSSCRPDADAEYVYDAALCSSVEIANFFGLLGPDGRY